MPNACIDCGRPTLGAMRCVDHRAEQNRIVKDRLASEGKCAECGRALTNGLSRCDVCTMARRTSGAKTRRERKTAGICVTCGLVAAAPEKTQCLACIAEKELVKEERRERGLCRYCDEPAANGRTQCERHLEYQREWARRKAAAK